MKKNYLIVPNPNYPFDARKFHDFIRGLYPIHINGWWNYVAGTTYIVSTNLGLNQLNSLVKQHMGSLQYLIIEVNSTQAQGWLPKEAWKWLGH